jgi:hypothetical protein
MTQALNLANFANKLNTSGQADNTSLQSGTYPISISGNAATATSATTAGSATSATNATNATNLVSGGTIASSVTGVTQTVGDNSTKIATTAFVQSEAIGYGQSWTDETSSRTSGTTYTNSTGKPIVVAINGNLLAGISIVVGGVTVATYGAINNSFNYQFMVPPGATYSYTGNLLSSNGWIELR